MAETQLVTSGEELLESVGRGSLLACENSIFQTWAAGSLSLGSRDLGTGEERVGHCVHTWGPVPNLDPADLSPGQELSLRNTGPNF